MNNPFHFLCLFGGPSSEYEVSLMSAYGVLSHLPKEVHGRPLVPFPVGVTRDGRWLAYSGDIRFIRDGSFCDRTEECAPAVLLPGGQLSVGGSTVKIHAAFPLIHGAFGEDGKLQGLLACLGIPFVGADWAASVCCMDKSVTKLLLSREGIVQARWIPVCRRTADEKEIAALPERVGKELGYPVFVKPAASGSSVGCVKVKSADGLLPALETAFAEGDTVLIEEYIVGKEVEAAVLEEKGELFIPSPGEIDPGAEFYDYDTKYKNDTAAYYIPPRIPAESAEEVRRLAGRIFRLLGCKGLSRVDFFVTDTGKVIFNEINTLPGFTPISMYPKMMAAGGVPYDELIARLLASAV